MKKTKIIYPIKMNGNVMYMNLFLSLTSTYFLIIVVAMPASRSVAAVAVHIFPVQQIVPTMRNYGWNYYHGFVWVMVVVV